MVQDLLETSPDGTYEYMGGTYLKGSQDSNYIWFDGFLWRIMGINEDGSIRMITQENVTAIPWGTNTQDYDNSYINDWLNNYFYPKLEHKDLLVNQTWCSEETIDSDSRRTTCTNNLSKIQKPVGLLSLDEYNLAGGVSNFFGNNQYFLLSTLFGKGQGYIVYSNGRVLKYDLFFVSGVRPVINIQSNISIISGTGTLQDPFVIEDRNITGNLNEHSLIGEYVMYAGRNYRVVETSSQGTKLILDGYYDSNNDGVIEESDEMAYGENCTLCTAINEDSFINWISNNNETEKNKLVSTTWYRGDYWGSDDTSYDYRINLESTSRPYEGRVGLIRLGEILSGHSETILSKNHTTSNSVSNAEIYWTVTLRSLNNAWFVSSTGYARDDIWYSKRAVRPVINIGPDVQITSGNGTFNSPYQI